MRNRLRKVLFGSITRELLMVNIISFFIIIIAAASAALMLMTGEDNTNNMVNNFNSLYVEANKYVTRKDKSCEEYLNKLALLYDCNAVVTDLEGDIILKSKNIDYDKIDMNKLHNFYHGSYTGGTFYQIYDMYIENQTYRLIVFKDPRSSSSYERNTLCILIITVLFVISITYFLTRKKAKYIKKIASGIKTISSGNLDYRIESKGADELAVLADEINNMTDNLKFQIEEERKAERLKSELITNVSHDLRTPLTSLNAYIQLASDDKTSPEDRRKYTKIAEEKSGRLKTLIEDLFEYSKLASGGIKLEKNNANIIEIMEQSIGELSIQAKERNISFIKNFESSNILLNVDPGKMARVFENVISNAVKYSPEGSTVSIDVKKKDSGAIISVENITEISLGENADKLFERFYRGDKSRNSEVGGSGLGLAIAKSIVELHSGCIYAESKGKVFKINIEL